MDGRTLAGLSLHVRAVVCPTQDRLSDTTASKPCERWSEDEFDTQARVVYPRDGSPTGLPSSGGQHPGLTRRPPLSSKQ